MATSNKPVKTNTPGIFKRGDRYVVIYRADGRQRWETAATMKEARQLKDARRAAVASGEFFAASRLTFEQYATEWVERYMGSGKGFRESTREDYRRMLKTYAYPKIGSLKVGAITPRDLANLIGWLCDEQKQGKRLADSTVRNALNPIRACLSTAVSEGLIRTSPARGLTLPHRPSLDLEQDEIRVLTAEQLSTVLAVVKPEYRVLFDLLASTGLRISEALALTWGHVELNGSSPHVKVRRAYVRGRMHPPKTRHGKRDVPIPHNVVVALRKRLSETEWNRETDLIFRSRSGDGKPLSAANLRRRVLAPALEEADASWAGGFHVFRHGCASMLFAQGRNAKQVQKWLGHHSPAFTLATYVHLLEGGIGAPLEINIDRTNAVQTQTSVSRESFAPEEADSDGLLGGILVGVDSLS